MSAVGRSSGISLHHQLYLVVRDRIITGRYLPGKALPTEGALGREFGVSRITVRRAIKALVDDQLIEKRHGSGTYVRDSHPRALQVPIRSFRKQAEDWVARTKSVVRDFSFITAPPMVIAALGLEFDAKTLRVERLRLRDDVPLVLTTAFIPEEIGRRFSVNDFAQNSLIQLMEASGYVHNRVSFRCSSTLADPLSASALDVPIGSPLTVMQQAAFHANGDPIELIVGLAPPERYEFEVSYASDEAEILPGMLG